MDKLLVLHNDDLQGTGCETAEQPADGGSRQAQSYVKWRRRVL
jgi:hypothetical protein